MEEDMSTFAVNFTMYEASANLTTSVLEIRILELCVFGFSFLFGVPTHSYVIWLIVTGTGSGVTSDFFVLHLSVCGIFFSVNSLLILLSQWVLSSSLLALSQFLLGPAITGSPLFQCLMCVERYLAVVHPVTFLKYKPLRYRVICCTAAWIITLGSCLIGILGFLDILTLHMWFLSVQFLLYLSIQLFCLVAVLRALKQSGPGERGREREEENHMKKRAFNLIRVVIAIQAITYAPFTITGLLSAVTEQLFPNLWSLSFICFSLAGLVPPIFYLHRIRKLGSCLSFCNV